MQLRLLRQLQCDEHWNTAGYDDTRWCQSDDSDSDKEIEESGDEEEEEKEEDKDKALGTAILLPFFNSTSLDQNAQYAH